MISPFYTSLYHASVLLAKNKKTKNKKQKEQIGYMCATCIGISFYFSIFSTNKTGIMAYFGLKIERLFTSNLHYFLRKASQA